MALSKVTIKGTGQLNGSKIINICVEMDRTIANNFIGSKKEQVIEAFVSQHYPGVKINPKNINVNIQHL